jgi:hypothetical protein
MGKPGYIYLAKVLHRDHPMVYKIGSSSQTPSKRIKIAQYQHFVGMEFVASAFVGDRTSEEFEVQSLYYLQSYEIRPWSGEFYRLTPSLVKEILEIFWVLNEYYINKVTNYDLIKNNIFQQHYSIPTMDEMKETAMAREVI